MDKAVSATDASRQFSKILQIVQQGHGVIVTSHGKPVAKIIPITEDREVARLALFARLRKERAVNTGRWMRNELYDNAQ